jgi:hypothetical protein
MKDEVARLCEQLGISQTEDGGGELLKVRDTPCPDTVGGFEQPQPTLSSGLPYTVSCQTSEVPVVD